jgi:hypothetical protein
MSVPHQAQITLNRMDHLLSLGIKKATEIAPHGFPVDNDLVSSLL